MSLTTASGDRLIRTTNAPEDSPSTILYSPNIDTSTEGCSAESACPTTSSKMANNSSSSEVFPSDNVSKILPNRINVCPLSPIRSPNPGPSSPLSLRISRRSRSPSRVWSIAAKVSLATSFSLASPSKKKHSSEAKNSVAAGTIKDASEWQSTCTEEDEAVTITSPTLISSPTAS